MAYRIQLPQFEGPLELLLTLIERQKLDVTRVSLAAVTDQYLEYVAQMSANRQGGDRFVLENLSHFLVIASRLILIKSKALLPLLSFDDEEEEEMADLEYRLAEYKKFKDISATLRGMLDAGRASFDRESTLLKQSFFQPPSDIGPLDIQACFESVLDAIPVFERLEERVVEEAISIEEKIVSLTAMIQRRAQATFSEITAHSKDKVEVIVSFLAMLELVKQRIVRVEQTEGLFGEIRISANSAKSDHGSE